MFLFYVGTTEAKHFSVSPLFCVYGWVCMCLCSFISRISNSISYPETFLGGSLLFSALPAGPGKKLSSLSPSPTPVSLFSSYLMSHLLQQNTHPPKGLRLSYSISLVPLISNPPKIHFAPHPPLPLLLAVLTSCHAI